MKITTTAFSNILAVIILSLIKDVQSFSVIRHSTINSPKSVSFYNYQVESKPFSYPNISSSKSIGSRPPPSLPPPPGDENNFQAILSTVLTVVGLTLFFISPLGGIFFAIFNSIFVLALVLPLIAVIGFQTWSAFNTIQGPCPNCGSNVVVMKDSEESNPSICINCGVLVRSTKDRKGIELCNAPPSDDFLGVGDGFGSIFDIFDRSSPSVRSVSSVEDKAMKRKRETTIIDVDASDD